MKIDTSDLFEELTELREFRDEIWPKYERELQMWRNKFLDSIDEIKENGWVRKYFLIAAPEHVLNKTPLGCVEDIKNILQQ